VVQTGAGGCPHRHDVARHLSTIELGWIIILDLSTPPIILPQISEPLEIFGFFLLILIGIDLLETLRAYLVEHVVHAEVVREVALIAIARKVIILEPKEMSGLTIFATAARFLALALGFLLVRRSRRQAADAAEDCDRRIWLPRTRRLVARR
jgi:uncharacterized membrane protein (DUF373 family)